MRSRMFSESGLRRLCCVIGIGLLASCGGSSEKESAANNVSAQVVEPSAAQRIALPDVTSSFTGGVYPISIYLPDGYSDSTRSYPVIYGLDAESKFDLSANMVEARGRDVILVFVGNAGSERRGIDYAMPGAQDYYAFITLELIPLIESQYRVDADQRTLSGHSLGALFTLLGMFFDGIGDQYFTSFLAIDPSLWVEEERTRALEQAYFEAAMSAPVTLFLAGATGEAGNYVGTENFYNYMLDREYTDLTMFLRSFDISHAFVYKDAFAAGIDLLRP